MTTLFISDLHLCGHRPEITRLFIDFLHDAAGQTDALYILGDLFEYWVGDDAVSDDQFRDGVAALRDFSARGTPLFVMHGNRDFLMRDGFERATGGRLLPDPHVIDLYGERVLLSHGDALCTADTQYMQFRRTVRSDAWQHDFLAKSFAERNQIVQSYRDISKATTASKSPEIMDVSQSEVVALLRTHRVTRMIHGHTHRPGEHHFDVDGKPAQRVVLGDWYQQGSVLRCDPSHWVLEAMPLRAH